MPGEGITAGLRGARALADQCPLPGAPARSELAQGTSTLSRVSLTHLSFMDLWLEGTYQTLRKGEMSYILDKELFDSNRVSPGPSL